MKKIVIAIFLVVFLSAFAFAQVNSEFQWLIGTWIDNEDDQWIFRNNGTVSFSWDSDSYYYSIGNADNAAIVTIFYEDGWGVDYDAFTVYRISNQQMAIDWNGDIYLLSKRN